jgi:hypothetical protein
MQVIRSAKISSCGRYRYYLFRKVSESTRTLVFVMLNPSTADGSIDDATIRRIMAFALAWGYGNVMVVNLFAFRATLPADLKRADDPIGPENAEHILYAIQHAETVVCGWGSQKGFDRMEQEVINFAVFASAMNVPLYCLHVNQDGSPKHPLYCRNDSALKRWYCNYDHPELL